MMADLETETCSC